MVLDAIRTEIITYPAITGYVTTYKNFPAVFGNKAPSDAAFPYVVISIDMANGGASIIDSGNIYIDLYDNNSSDANQIASALNVLNSLDGKTLTNADYANIRCFRENWGTVEDSSEAKNHYSLQFEFRATRKTFIQSKL